MPGPAPKGDHALTPAERTAAWRARKRAAEAETPKPAPIVRHRKPVDRRSRPQQWDDACATLAGLLDQFQDWRDNLPPGLADSATANRLDEVLALRDLVDQLAAAELPKGFGRD